MKKFKRGQSTLEYVIILAAVVGAIVAVAAIVKKKLIIENDTTESTYGILIDKAGDKIESFDFKIK